MVKRTRALALQTRQRILHTALELFSTKGYDKTSLTDIARGAEVTRGAVYWHFEDKGELLMELFRQLACENQLNQHLVAATRDSEPDPLGCLRQWVKMHGRSGSVQLFTSVVITILDDIIHSSSNRDGEMRKRLMELIKNRLDNIREGLQQAVRRGQLPTDSDVDLIAEVLQAFLVGYLHVIRNNSHANFTRNFDQVVDTMFNSITNFRLQAPGPGSAGSS